MNKKFWQSKTLWTNIIALISSIGGMASGTIGLQEGLPIAVMAAVNIFLRLITKEPISFN